MSEYEDLIADTGPITPYLRERLRVLADARQMLAWRLDPEDTMTWVEAIEGHDAELAALYNELAAADEFVQALA